MFSLNAFQSLDSLQKKSISNKFHIVNHNELEPQVETTKLE